MSPNTVTKREILAYCAVGILLMSSTCVRRFEVRSGAGGLSPCASLQADEAKVTEIDGSPGRLDHHGPVAFSPDGWTLALGEADGRVELRSLRNRSVRTLVSSLSKRPHPVESLLFSTDAQRLAVHYQGTGLSVWQLSPGRELVHIPMREDAWVGGMAFLDGGRTLLGIVIRVRDAESRLGELDQSAYYWDAHTGNTIKVVVINPRFRFVALSPNGQYVIQKTADAGDVSQYSLFDTAMHDSVSDFRAAGRLVFSHDSLSIVSCSGKTITIWEVPSAKQIKRFETESSLEGGYRPIYCMSPNNRLLAIGRFRESHVVGVISLESGRLLGKFECGSPDSIGEGVLFSPDGRTLITYTDTVSHNDKYLQPFLKFWRLPAAW